MAKLTAKQRDKLPDRAFAYIDSKGKRRLPINDEAHVKNALARFNQVAFEDDAARERARRRLLRAAKKFGIVPVGFVTGQLHSEKRKTEQLRKDLNEAQKIQTGLLPKRAPNITGFKVSGVCRPCEAVGGDWFDYVQLDDGRLVVVLADVAGKGMGAALLMSSTRSVVRLVARGGHAPAAVLDEINKTLVADLPAAKFVTMIYAVIDPAERAVTFANAGHLPPILVDGDEAVTLKSESELPLGVNGGRRTDRRVELTPGSRLFLYSDGVVETRNRKSEEYGEDRLLAYVAQDGATARGLLQDVIAFKKSRSAIDDITVVTIEASM